MSGWLYRKKDRLERKREPVEPEGGKAEKTG